MTPQEREVMEAVKAMKIYVSDMVFADKSEVNSLQTLIAFADFALKEIEEKDDKINKLMAIDNLAVDGLKEEIEELKETIKKEADIYSKAYNRFREIEEDLKSQLSAQKERRRPNDQI